MSREGGFASGEVQTCVEGAEVGGGGVHGIPRAGGRVAGGAEA
jgi:hypothetical protein